MKNILLIFFFLFTICKLNAKESLSFYLNKALENNMELKAERKNFDSAKQNKNISRSEFLPSILFQEIRLVLPLRIELIKTVQV